MTAGQISPPRVTGVPCPLGASVISGPLISLITVCVTPFEAAKKRNPVNTVPFTNVEEYVLLIHPVSIVLGPALTYDDASDCPTLTAELAYEPPTDTYELASLYADEMYGVAWE